MSDYPKFKWSSMDGGEQVVIRDDEWINFRKNVDLAKTIIAKKPQTEARPAEQKSETSEEEGASVRCEMHSVNMPYKVSKKGNAYWNHTRKVDGEWETCWGKGYTPNTKS